MDEETTTEQATTEAAAPTGATPDTKEGVQPKDDSALGKMGVMLQRYEAVDKSLGEKLDQLSGLRADQLLAGRAEAGVRPKSEADLMQEKVDEFVKGIHV